MGEKLIERVMTREWCAAGRLKAWERLTLAYLAHRCRDDGVFAPIRYEDIAEMTGIAEEVVWKICMRVGDDGSPEWAFPEEAG
jgi:hypothetical protein